MGGAFSSAFSTAFDITVSSGVGSGQWVPTRIQSELAQYLVRKIRRRPSMWKPTEDGPEPIE